VIVAGFGLTLAWFARLARPVLGTRFLQDITDEPVNLQPVGPNDWRDVRTDGVGARTTRSSRSFSLRRDLTGVSQHEKPGRVRMPLEVEDGVGGEESRAAEQDYKETPKTEGRPRAIAERSSSHQPREHEALRTRRSRSTPRTLAQVSAIRLLA